jgi:hypothetical protein
LSERYNLSRKLITLFIVVTVAINPYELLIFMARADRYSRILTSAKYYAAIDNYIKYITDASKRGSRVGEGDPRPKSKVLWIRPFFKELAENQKVKVSAAEPTWTSVRNITGVGTRVSETAPGDGNDQLKLKEYSAARVVIVRGRTAQGVKKVSKVTGMPYLSYGGKSTSFPFGSANDTDLVEEAYNEIRTAILGSSSFSGAIVSLIPEKY